MHETLLHGKIPFFFAFSCAYIVWSKRKTCKSSWKSYRLLSNLITTCCKCDNQLSKLHKGNVENFAGTAEIGKYVLFLKLNFIPIQSCVE